MSLRYVCCADLVMGFEHIEYTVTEGEDPEAEVCVIIYEPDENSLGSSFIATALLIPAGDSDTAEGESLHMHKFKPLIYGGACLYKLSHKQLMFNINYIGMPISDLPLDSFNGRGVLIVCSSLYIMNALFLCNNSALNEWMLITWVYIT